MTNFSNKQVHCKNCGKVGHLNKNCPEPITSFGIICIQVSDSTAEKLKNVHYVDISKQVTLVPVVSVEKPKVLMVQRKHSLGYMDFMRGKYDPLNEAQLVQIFEYMSSEEIAMVERESFDTLWKKLWAERSFWRQYLEEYKAAKYKYNILISQRFGSSINPLLYYVYSVRPKYSIPEWGFPKGRRSCKEKEVDCARREFEEESGYTRDDYILLDNVSPIAEIFYGTDGILYKHIYYVAVLKNNKKLPTILPTNKEIGDIGWFTRDTALALIRPYHVQKKHVLSQVLNFVSSV